MSKPRNQSKPGFTLIEMLVVIAIIGVLTSLLLPAVQAVRESGRRTQCANHMKQLALAVQTFHDARGHLPASIRPSGLTTAPRTAGMTLLLPFFERNDLFDRYDQARSWNEIENREVVLTRIPTLMCPSSVNAERLDGIPENTPWCDDAAGVTDYSPTTGVDQRLKSANLVDAAGPGLLTKNGRPSFSDVTDGLSNTILFAESAGRPRLFRKGALEVTPVLTNRVNGGGWARPASDFSVDGASRDGGMVPGSCAMNCTNGESAGDVFPHPYYGTEGTSEAYAFHPTGANFAFGDGSVRLLDEGIDIREFARLVTRSEGEACLNLH